MMILLWRVKKSWSLERALPSCNAGCIFLRAALFRMALHGLGAKFCGQRFELGPLILIGT
jgi:hypothetical protein